MLSKLIIITTVRYTVVLLNLDSVYPYRKISIRQFINAMKVFNALRKVSEHCVNALDSTMALLSLKAKEIAKIKSSDSFDKI